MSEAKPRDRASSQQPLPLTVVESGIWVYGAKLALTRAPTLDNSATSAPGLDHLRVVAAAVFLLYYGLLKCGTDPFAKHKNGGPRVPFKPLATSLALLVGLVRILHPDLAIFHNLCAIAAAVALCTAAISALNITLEVFVGFENPMPPINDTPFLGRVYGHLLQHSSLLENFLNHPNQIELTFITNLLACPSAAVWLAKFWLGAREPMTPLIWMHLWKYSGFYALLWNGFLLLMTADGGVRTDGAEGKRRSRSNTHAGRGRVLGTRTIRAGDVAMGAARIPRKSANADPDVQLPDSESNLMEAFMYAMSSQGPGMAAPGAERTLNSKRRQRKAMNRMLREMAVMQQHED